MSEARGGRPVREGATREGGIGGPGIPASRTTKEIEAPVLLLRSCSVEEHCRALITIRKLPYWWYQKAAPVLGNFTIPFQDGSGAWWYQVKPGLAWPVDFYRPVIAGSARLPLSKSYLGYQHVTPAEGASNSRLVINTVWSLEDYRTEHIESKRRTKIRAGLKCCELSVLSQFDKEIVDGCRAAWEDLTSRTGWKGAVPEDWFDESWRMLLDVPGVSVIVARDRASGRVAGFHITKIVGDTAYGDAVASHSALFQSRVNDAMVYGFLVSARRLPGVRRAHYAIKSYVASLERFKTSMGFEARIFPAWTAFRPLVGSLVRWVRPASYRRMVGDFGESPDGTEGEGRKPGTGRPTADSGQIWEEQG